MNGPAMRSNSKAKEEGQETILWSHGGYTSVAEPEAGFRNCLLKGTGSLFCKEVFLGAICNWGQGLPVCMIIMAADT